MTATKPSQGLWLPVLAALCAGALYLFGLDRYPEFDELYHVLAAQGWLATGEPRIAEGVYRRDSPFTEVIAFLFARFGVSIEVARLPSVVAAAMLVGVMFAWLRREAGAVAAAIGTGLFAISPFAIEIAQFARGYAIQLLTFFGAAVAIYRLVIERRFHLRAAAYAVGAVIGLAIAFSVQIATAAGLAGVAAWSALVVVGPWILDPKVAGGRKLLAGTVVLVGAAGGLVVLTQTGLLGKVLAPLSDTNLTIASRGSPIWYYHLWLILYYPTLWSLVPILTLAALAAAPRPAFFALCVFVVAFLVHSVAAAKNLRYFAYAMPFLFVLWGIGLAAVAGAVAKMAGHAARGALQAFPAGLAAPLSRVAIGVAIVFLVVSNAATIRSLSLLVGFTVPPEIPPPRWELVREPLGQDLATAGVVVTSSELEHLNFLGRYDVLYSRSRLAEVLPPEPFVADYRTGRPVIGNVEDLALLMACFDTGLVVSPISRWRNTAQIDDAAADLLVRHAEPIDLQGSRIVAFRWSKRLGIADSCPIVPTHPQAGAPAQ